MKQKRAFLHMLAVVTIGLLAVSAAGSPDPAEFEKVQRAMNERIEELEAELQTSRQAWQAREHTYQAEVQQLQQRSQQLEAALEATEQRPADARDWGQGWSVRRVSTAENAEEDAALEEAEEGETPAWSEPEEVVGEPPFEIIDPTHVGRRRIKTRREANRWRPAMEFGIRNLTDTPLRISAWAHQPGRMGWNLDEFGVTLLSVPPLATITEQIIAHDPGTDLHILIDGKTYTFEVESR